MSEQVVTTTKAAAPEVCHVGGSGLLLPREYEQTWDMAARTIIYIAFLLWLFIGVAIVADVFMGAIEAITSKKETRERQDIRPLDNCNSLERNCCQLDANGTWFQCA